MFYRNYNILRETRVAYDSVKKYAIDYNGIIYGGYVRDTFLKDCNVSQFFENDENDKTKFWDPTYDGNTIDRLLIPKDIDICFKNGEDSIKFVNKLGEEGFQISNEFNFRTYNLFSTEIIQKRFTATFVIARSLTNKKGINVCVKIDMCISDIEPPFNRVDMTVNSLVEDRGGIRMSNNTGREIYGNQFKNTFVKKQIECKILSMIARKETELVSSTNNYAVKSKIIKRVAKMIDRGWTFLNVDWMELEVDCNNICTICMETTNPENSIIINKGSHFHRKCFKGYIRSRDIEVDNEGNYGIKCPLRNILTF